MRLGPAEVRFTDRSDGDFRPPGAAGDTASHDAQSSEVLASEVLAFEALASRRRHVTADFPWTWLRQVHGADVVVVESPAAHAGISADAAVAVLPCAPVAVVTADCAPVVLVDDDGACVAVAHAGWRGLYEGVLGATVAAMRARGAGSISGALGPCIHAECYEFSDADLETMVDRFGASVRSTTATGTPALDMVAAVRASLRESDIHLVDVADACTACSPDHWSHRARRDEQRQATVAWLS